MLPSVSSFFHFSSSSSHQISENQPPFILFFASFSSQLPTLADARGKLIFVQRTQFENPSIGIALPPSEFHDNDPSFSIVYNPSTGASAFIEDFYNLVPNPSSFANKVKLKLDATFQNLRLAIGDSHPNQLFISFASGGALRNLPPVTPQVRLVFFFSSHHLG